MNESAADNNPFALGPLHEPGGQRVIRSYVLREGRLTPGQQKALAELWPIYGINAGNPIDLASHFGREAPTVFEIGFGNGDAILQMASEHPETNFIGVEVHRPGVGRLLLKLHEQGLKNIRVMRADAMEVLCNDLPAGSLQGLHLFFPDPWHKKKHHKRRIVQPQFLSTVAQALAADGYIHMATDWAEYAEHMLEQLQAHHSFTNTAVTGNYIERPSTRPETHFERRGLKRGHQVFDLIFSRTPSSS